MLMRLVRPVKRSGSTVPQFVKRIPTDVRAHAIGQTITFSLGLETVAVKVTPAMETIRFSLRTKDPAVAKTRQAECCATFERFCAALRQNKPVSLTHKQCTALAGELYRAWADAGRERTIAISLAVRGGPWVRDMFSPEEEALAFASQLVKLEALAEQTEAGDLEAPLGSIVDRLLMRVGIGSVDSETRPMLLQAALLALKDAIAYRRRNAEGDYSPDYAAGRFPEWSDLSTPAPTPSPIRRGKVTFTDLVDGWWTEAKAAGRKVSTHVNYSNSIAVLAAFLGHDDAQRVTVDDVLRFKDHRLTRVSAKTVKDSDLAALKTLFGWGVANRKVPFNPAAGVSLKVGKAPKLRSKGFTEGEAIAILKAAIAYQGSTNETPRTVAAKRWVPWLQAYTGARVGELAQLRKQDVRREAGHWVIRITPEAGTVKTNEAREVVLHAHLVELGFTDFVVGAGDGHLFLKPAKNGDVLGPLRGLKNRLAEFGRSIVPDPNVAPNHGWRHRFKTVGMEAGIAHRILDAIQGQASRTVADSYGDVTVRTMAAAIAKLPRIEVATAKTPAHS